MIGLSAVTESFQLLVQLAVKIRLITFCNMLILLRLPLSSETTLKNSTLARFQIYCEIVFVLMSWHSLIELWEMFVSQYLNPCHCLHFCMNGFTINLILILKDLFKRRQKMMWTGNYTISKKKQKKTTTHICGKAWTNPIISVHMFTVNTLYQQHLNSTAVQTITADGK